MEDVRGLVNKIQDDFRAGKLKVPSLPEVAIKINKYVGDPNANTANMARIIQLDPALTAKLLQAANSALYGGNGQVQDCRTAIARLGMETTRNMVMSFALGQSFKVGSAVVKDVARGVWHKSSDVAAISYVLARVTMGMVPDKALLAGLVHNIGAIPILHYAAEDPEIKKNRVLINDLIDRLSGKLGSLVLRQWSFDEALTGVPKEILNNNYQPDEKVNYVDIVIVANVHSQFGKDDKEAPKLHEIASFRKLPLFQIGPDASIELLYTAKEEINSLTKMLTSIV
ncbi:MAG: HDOD domain-containing protein [Gammaproteobacteria bacterium]|nr:HDOD domain-containing protein [Gammaproteobacteria bacterium]